MQTNTKLGIATKERLIRAQIPERLFCRRYVFPAVFQRRDGDRAEAERRGFRRDARCAVGGSSGLSGLFCDPVYLLFYFDGADQLPLC